MGAPKGHPMWGNPLNPKVFNAPKDLWESACKYFQYCDANPWVKNEAIKSGDMVGTTMEVETAKPYTLTGLCCFLNISLETFSNYSKNQDYKTFFGVCKQIREIVYTQKFEGAAVGVFNANIIARDLGLSEKKDVEKTITTYTPAERANRIEEIKDKLGVND